MRNKTNIISLIVLLFPLSTCVLHAQSTPPQERVSFQNTYSYDYSGWRHNITQSVLFGRSYHESVSGSFYYSTRYHYYNLAPRIDEKHISYSVDLSYEFLRETRFFLFGPGIKVGVSSNGFVSDAYLRGVFKYEPESSSVIPYLSIGVGGSYYGGRRAKSSYILYANKLTAGNYKTVGKGFTGYYDFSVGLSFHLSDDVFMSIGYYAALRKAVDMNLNLSGYTDELIQIFTANRNAKVSLPMREWESMRLNHGFNISVRF